MRKLKLQMSTSVDGFVARINGEQDWIEWNQDEQFKKYYRDEILAGVDTILMGRKMSKEFTSYWENVVNNKPASEEFAFAQKLVEMPKIVFSKTIKVIEGKNVSIENGDLATVVNQLKNKDGGDVIVYGGANFVSSLIKNNLIDEFNFFINHTAIGNGLKVFTDTRKLKLVNSKSYECGVVANQYIPENG